MKTNKISIVIPAKNEEKGLEILLSDLNNLNFEKEIIVVNDGSTDATVEVCNRHNVICISHPYSKGNGAAIKTGARTATSDSIIFMDADNQHTAKDLENLINFYQQGNYDMVVGARNISSHASKARLIANTIYNKLASLIVERKIKDLTSGFRIVNRKKFLGFLYLLPNGFSYPTTSTMAFFRAGYSVEYFPIQINPRLGTSHINIIKDGVRFLLIIFKVGTLYSPLKVFAPISFGFFVLASVQYLITYFTSGHFTNMGALLYITSLLIFLMGLISEQITMLLYKKDK